MKVQFSNLLHFFRTLIYKEHHYKNHPRANTGSWQSWCSPCNSDFQKFCISDFQKNASGESQNDTGEGVDTPCRVKGRNLYRTSSLWRFRRVESTKCSLGWADSGTVKELAPGGDAEGPQMGFSAAQPQNKGHSQKTDSLQPIEGILTHKISKIKNLSWTAQRNSSTQPQ